ncbi:hypothetical protein [Methylobacterium radiotolerans]|uniref:hypothetical protein n=1 Tax=Methylobacterium radiotolerans TaxID=31998 RepID=UPI0038D026A4
MAEALGLAIFSAVGAEAAAATTILGISAATLAGSTALLGAGVGLNLIAASFQDPNKVAAQQLSLRQPLPSRTRSYGTVKVAGPFIQYRSVGAFIYAVYHGEGPWDAITEWWLDDIKCASIPAGSLGGAVQDVPWRNYVAIESHLGQVGQGVSPILSGTQGWTGSHVLNGCVYSAVKNTLPPERSFKKFYPKQTWSNLRVVGRANLVRTPFNPNGRTWSDRSGDCIFDFLTHETWGMRVPLDLMNFDKWKDFSSLCSEPVVPKDPNLGGGTIPRYYLGGTYNLTDDPADTLNAMLATCDGMLTLEDDGTIGIRGGKPPTPGFEITDEMILSVQIEAGGPLLMAYNRLKCAYVSPFHDYQQVEGQPWDDLTAQQRSGELLEEDFARPWVNNFNQIRRLAKIAMAKGNPDFKLVITTTLAAAAAVFEEAVTLASDTYPIFDDLLFLVGRAVINVEAKTCTLEITSLDPACYSFDAATEEGLAPALPNTAVAATPPAPPQNLSVATETRAITANDAGSYNAVFLRLTAVQPADRQDLSLVGRYRVVGNANWTEMAADTDNPLSLISGVLVNGATYEVEGAMATYGRALVSDYIAAAGSPVTINNAAPQFPQQPPTDPGTGSGTSTT